MAGKSGFVFQGSLTNPGPFASFDNGTQSAAIGIDSTGRLVISRLSTEGASSSDVGEFVVDTSGNIEMNPTSTVTVSTGNLVLTTGFVETTSGVMLIGSSSGNITLEAPASVSTYALEFPSSQGTSGQVLTQSGTPGILDWATPTTGTVTSVTATSPVFSSGGSTPNITIQAASGSQEGALLAADWTTFNNKVGSVTASSPLSSSGGTTPNLTIQSASGSQEGALLAADWTTFNNKVAQGGNSYSATMSVGTNDFNSLDLRTNGTNRVTIDTSGNVAVLGTGTLATSGGLILNGSTSGSVTMESAATVSIPYTLIMPSAQGSAGQVLTQSPTPGILAWDTPTTGTVTSVTASSPLSSSGGSTPNITIQSASGSQEGALLAADWTTFNNKVSDGGNSYGALMTIGTNDSNNLEFLTNGVNRLTIDTSGNLTLGTSQASIIFPSTSGTVTMKAAASSFSYTIQLPAIAGSSGQCLTQSSTPTVLNWQSFLPLSGGTITGSLTITNGGDLQLQGTSSLGFFQMLASSTTSSYSVTMPPSQGTSGQVLTQSGTPGILQWSTPTTGTVTSVTGTSPIASSGGSTPAISIQNATTSQAGALTSTDWNTFNNKVGSVTASSPLSSSGGTSPNLTIQSASGSQEGALLAADWTTFNNKVSDGGNSYSASMSVGTNDNNTLTLRTNNINRVTLDTSGNLTVGGSGTLGTTGGLVLNGSTSGALTVTSAATTSSYAITMPSSQGSANQVLAQSGTPGTLQWTTPNAGTVTSVTGTSPIASSGGATPAISIQTASGSQAGALASSDWTTFNNKVSDGGNSYGSSMSVGTNDNNTLTLRTNNSNRVTLDTSGNLTVGGSGTLGTTGGLVLNGSSSGSMTMVAPATISSSYSVTMPSAQGSANQVLAQSSSAGTLQWTTPVTVDTLAFTNGSQAAQTVGTSAPGTQIVFNSTASPGYHLNPPNSTYSTSTGSFTPAATGYYLVLCNVQVSTTTAPRTVVLYLYNNTTSTMMYSGETILNNTGGLYQLSMSGVINLSSADTYGIYVQASSTGVTVVAGVAYPLNYVNFMRIA